jgi:hypothetical protein
MKMVCDLERYEQNRQPFSSLEPALQGEQGFPFKHQLGTCHRNSPINVALFGELKKALAQVEQVPTENRMI